jgi:hypothetical protein
MYVFKRSVQQILFSAFIADVVLFLDKNVTLSSAMQ